MTNTNIFTIKSHAHKDGKIIKFCSKNLTSFGYKEAHTMIETSLDELPSKIRKIDINKEKSGAGNWYTVDNKDYFYSNTGDETKHKWFTFFTDAVKFQRKIDFSKISNNFREGIKEILSIYPDLDFRTSLLENKFRVFADLKLHHYEVLPHKLENEAFFEDLIRFFIKDYANRISFVVDVKEISLDKTISSKEDVTIDELMSIDLFGKWICNDK